MQFIYLKYVHFAFRIINLQFYNHPDRMVKDEEAQIITDFLNGDKDAYVLMYKTYVKELYNYGKAFTSDTEMVKDAIQDIFCKILCKRSLLSNIHNLKCFLFISLKNRLIDMNRKVLTFNENEYPITNFTVTNITILDDLIEEENRQEISQKIKSLLEQLTDHQREAVCLRYIYDMEYKDIAQILKMENEKSARNLVSRAIQKLKSENVYILFLFSLIKLN